MKFLSFVCGFAVLSGTVFGHAIRSSEEAAISEQLLEKRQGAILPITGPAGAVRPRLEVRQLKAKANQWSLFLLAVKQMQETAQTSKTSWYQISGIHGVPNVDWDGVGKCSDCGNADGYCTHDSILFLGWHRAYVALLEQELIKAAKNIAAQYPAGTKRTQMQNAANQLRMPYWDWAAKPKAGQPTLPPLMTSAQVTVNGPNGNQRIANPLFSYKFTSSSALKYTPFTQWPATLRYPTSNANNAVSDTQKAIAAFDNIRASMQDQVYQMFSTCDEFVEVGADTAGQSSVRCSNSLENIHNTIHTTGGGPKQNGISGGHLTYLATAAFDPLFWLHHTNVDRLFAMWQALWPDSYGGSQVAPHNTWTIAQGTTQNANSPLTPFHRDAAGNFWTTNLVRDTKVFKYTYPEFSNSDGSKSAIAGYVNRLYGPDATATAGSSKRNVARQEDDSESTTTTSTSATSTAEPSAAVEITPLRADNGSLYQYVANIQTARYALGGSYTIYLFNGAPASDDPASWILDPNLIGPMGVLAQTGMTADVVATGSVPLTRVLSDQVTGGVLAALSQALVVPYLKSKLQWRVAGVNGEKIDPETIPDFEISVYASTATPATESELPIWSEFIPLAKVTESKAGGATIQSIESALEAYSLRVRARV
ncbi:hypothetical protein LTR37_005896 [Vermiconidia calcicola]|uniref:Uncharacterized protein n=1 Tax=Vermiconidia calcicola TaxID=1690605 RepID=A0ACC3NHH7_9PEZI|nr:hypothetical protein LTR37_005896 [Vermiconidia calcicola]